MRRTGVPTKRSKSRQRSRIHGDDFAGAEEADCFRGAAFDRGIFASGNACVAIAV